MSLKSTIDQDIKEAMKAKDQVSLRALRAIKSQIMLAETAEGRKDEALTEEEEMTSLPRKKRNWR